MKEGICPYSSGKDLVDKLYCDSFAQGKGCFMKNKCRLYHQLEEDKEGSKIRENLEIIK